MLDALVTWLFSAVVIFMVLELVDTVVGLRVSQPDEIGGLTLAQYGKEG